MRIKAYILVADPAWIEPSVLSYYDIVEEIIVSYDQDRLAWTGAPIPAVDECLDRLKAIDRDKKMRLSPGHYARLDHKPMENETYQRQCCIEEAGSDIDWVLQLDTDELLPDSQEFVRRLDEEVPAEYQAVDWPMRTFFQRTPAGGFLEVCSLLRKQISSYPGHAAVRPGTVLHYARQTQLPCWRYDVRPKDTDPAAGNRPVHAVLPEDKAILHFSWIRTEEEIYNKLKSYGHSNEFDWQRYYEQVWKAAPRRWRWMVKFHPFCGYWWPALRQIQVPPSLLRTS